MVSKSEFISDIVFARSERRPRGWVRKHSVTFGLVGFITAVFLGQVTLTNQGEFDSIRSFSESLFLANPQFGWFFAPFLHKGYPHFFKNVILIGFTGYFAEQHLSRRAYLVGVLGVGYVTIGLEALYLLATEGGPVMVISASGTALSIATYTGFHLSLSHDFLSEIDGYGKWANDYWDSFTKAPLQTVEDTMAYFSMVTGLIYPLVQSLNDWTGLLSASNSVAGIAHLVGILCGLLTAMIQR